MRIGIILLFLLSFYCAKAQFFAPAYPNSINKNNLIVDYDFSQAVTYPGTGTAVTATNGSPLSATMVNSPTYFADPGYLKFVAASSQHLLMGDLKNYYPPTSGSTRSGVFTVSLWFNPTATNGVVLADIGQTAIAQDYHTSDIEMVNGYLKFSVWPKSTLITTASTVSLNVWHHVVLTYTGTQVIAYLDGGLVGTATYTRSGPAMYSLTSSQYFAVAARDGTHMGSGAYGSFLLGDLKYFAAALSASEVSRLYADEEPNYDLVLMFDAGNTASYPGTGTTWYDISGAAKTATNTAGVTTSTSGGGSLYYNGSTSTYTDFSFDLNGASELTIEMWVYWNASVNGMFFGFNLYDVWTNGGALGFNTANADLYGISAAQVSSLGLISSWKHYVFVMSSTSMTANKIYINGVSQSLSQIYASTYPANLGFNAGAGRIGLWRANTTFPNQMHVGSFKIYDREITQTEITNKFDRTKARYGY